MIYFSLGLPGACGEWCDTVLVEAARTIHGHADFAAAHSLEDLATAVLQMKGPTLVIASRQPATKLKKALTANDARFLLALPAARHSVGQLALRGMDVRSALRAVASSASALSGCSLHGKALTITPGGDPSQTFRLARAICDHFDLALGDSALTAIVERLAAAGLTPDPSGAEDWWNALDANRKRLIDNATGSSSDAGSGEPARFSWEPELFFRGDPPNDAATGAIDITGRVRCLAYGPFILVRPGSWNIHATFATSKEAAGVALLVEAFAGSPLGQARVQAPQGGGVFEANLAFTIDPDSDAADHPFQVRIFNERAAFDGKLGLGTCTLYAQNKPPAQIGPEIAAHLGAVANARSV